MHYLEPADTTYILRILSESAYSYGWFGQTKWFLIMIDIWLAPSKLLFEFFIEKK